MNTESVFIRVSPELKEALTRLAKEQGESVSTVGRTAIREYIKREAGK